MDEFLKCEHSNASYCAVNAVLLCGTVCYVVQVEVVVTFESMDKFLL